TFSFTHAGMCRLFADTYGSYRATVIDPELDWAARGLPIDEFDAPVQNNLSRLFAVMHAHAGRYVETYYDSDESIRGDRAVKNWIAELNQLIPNGIDGNLQGQVTRDSVARLIAGFIYLATVQHEALGTCMWNYQAWVGKHPIRVHENGERVPLDVYQRLVNANFNLNVNRAKLIQDFSHLALDPKGADLFKIFKRELEALQAELAREDFAYWRIMPEMLDANINA
ncbi:MAG: hypothetical protein O7G83_06310, partial [Proteobacteria bacterium]|nr:hypothetical protein [Pseudomonadota bacterium]